MRRHRESNAAEALSQAGDEFARFVRHAEASGDVEELSLRDWVELAETWRITKALRDSRGNRSAAARALGIGRRTLYAKMEKLGIAPTWSVVDN